MPELSCWNIAFDLGTVLTMSTSYWTIVLMFCAIWAGVRIVEGYQNAAGEWTECPEGYEQINSMCYKQNRCEEGYFLHTDGMCYLIEPKPCPNEITTEDPTTTTEEFTTTIEESTTTTEEPTTTTEEPTTTTEEPTTTTEEPTTTTEEPTTTTAEPTTTTEEPTTTTEEPTTTTEEATTTTEEPTKTTEEPTTTTEEPTTTTTTDTPSLAPDEQVRCPPGSIYFNEQCRKILCTQGEYYEGRCLSPACPTGTVWRGKRCQPPGYITTILEIDNVIKNQFEYRAVTENVNHVEYYTPKPYDPTMDAAYETTTPFAAEIASKATTTLPPKTNVQEVYPGAVPPDGCCLVMSPRLCRPYPPKWACFNRRMKLCDARICTRPVIYLKPTRIVELTDPPMLVMPPNPPLLGCETSNCTESDVLNCSGCAMGERNTCSQGCYNYFCPGDSCQYKNLDDFCALYPGGFGCNIHDGYGWNSNSCTNKCH